MEDWLKRRLVDDINSHPSRLAVLTGAGLSMATPSDLPSASELAQECAQKYRVRAGEDIPEEVEQDLGGLASELWDRDQLKNPFLRRVVPWEKFWGTPNRGHEAIADLLICGGLDFAATTNFDVLVEMAGNRLGPLMEGALNGGEINDIGTSRHRPYLKMHGCAVKKKRETLWCDEQLQEPPYSDIHIPTTTRWLGGRIEYRDLIIVGFWTDWNYIIEFLENCLFGVTLEEDRLFIIVDPKPEDRLERDAPQLWEWIHSQDGVDFHHEQMSGETFLRQLRVAYSRRFLARAIAEGSNGEYGGDLFEDLNDRELYRLRQDFTGQPHSRPVKRKEPRGEESRVGQVHAVLMDAGAEIEGPVYKIYGKTLRIINAAGYRRSDAKQKFTRESGSPLPVDIVVCVGARRDESVSSIVGGRFPGQKQKEEQNKGNVVTAKHESTWMSEDGFYEWLEEEGDEAH